MCFDFRHDPTGVRVVDTGEVFPVNTVWLNGVQDMNTVVEAGMYGIPATGSYVTYFDGTDWHSEGNKTKYEFVRPEGFKRDGVFSNLDLTFMVNGN